MSSYTEIDTALLDLDFTNPRIQNYLQNYPEESRSGELLAMLLGTGTDSCASLKESIKEHGGIINPIIVNHFPDGRYVVIEGNTRLQIYRDFIRDNVPGNWNKIRAIIYENLENNEMHSIRLQAHLVGPRDWDAYAKAKYLTFLSDEEKMPMKELLAYCGGSSKASEIRYMIQAYKDMRDDYEKNSAYKELLSQFTEWANEMSRQIRHRSYERSLTQSDKKFLADESVTDVDGVDISLGTELDSYDMDDSDSVANTDLLSKLSLLMDMGKKKTKYNVLNLNSKFTVDQKQTLEHVFDALYAKYTNAKANDIIQTIIDSF